MFENIQFRLVKVSQADKIALMSRDLIEVGLGWQWTPLRVTKQIRCRDSVVLGAWAGGRLVGFAMMHFLEEDAHLLLLAVEPSYRRCGTGRRLIEWLEKSARVAGIFRIHLEVRVSNQGARSFYRALGYHETRLIPGYYSGRETAVRMLHDLRVVSP